MIFLAGCTEKKKDNSDKIAELQEQIAELSQDGNNQAALEELQRQLAELSQNDNNQAALEELQRQLAELSQNGNNQAALEELQRQVAELSQRTIDESVIVSCTCVYYVAGGAGIRNLLLEGAGVNKAEAVIDARKSCKTIGLESERDSNYINYCQVKN